MPTEHENPHAPDPEIEKESAKLGYEVTEHVASASVTHVVLTRRG